MRCHASLLVALVVLSAPTSSSAQSVCGKAQAALRSDSASLEEVLPVLSCPGASGDIATALTRIQSSTEPARLSTTFSLAAGLRDDAVARRLSALVESPATSEPARAWALYALTRQLSRASMPPTPDDASLRTVDHTCMVVNLSVDQSVPGRPVAAATIRRGYDLAVALFRNVAESPRVRSLANCLWFATVRQVQTVPTAEDLSLSYICGRVFEVGSKHLGVAKLTWDVEGSSEHGSVTLGNLSLAGRIASQRIVTRSPGTLRLYLNGVLVQSAPDRRIGCRP